MKKDILVPFDGSKNAIEALHLAVTLAKVLQEKLVILNIQPAFHTVNTKRFFTEQTIRDYQVQLFEETVAPAREILENSGIEYEIILKTGDAKEMICQQAMAGADASHGCATTGVRMIIMGSRGMNPILGGVLGSVSYGVVNAASCPVTIVPYSCSE